MKKKAVVSKEVEKERKRTILWFTRPCYAVEAMSKLIANNISMSVFVENNLLVLQRDLTKEEYSYLH